MTLLTYPEPAAVWSIRRIVFDNENISLAQNIILSQGAEALSSLVRRIEQLYEFLGAFPQLKNAYIHTDIPSTLSDLCYHQGMASKILFDNSAKGGRENKVAYKMRIERSEYVLNLCKEQNVEFGVLSDRTVRNRLTHVDEYLFDAMRQPNTGWFIDTAIHTRDEFVAPQGIQMGFCRTFIVSENKILHLGSEISVLDLYTQAIAVLRVVFGIDHTRSKIMAVPDS